MSSSSDSESDAHSEAPSKGTSPAPVQPIIRHSAIDLKGRPRLMVLQEPQENFHKDEGGKANQLTFRVMLQGELPQDIVSKASDGTLQLAVRPVFDDGQNADISILDIVGGTDTTNPAIVLRTRVGGVRYRFNTVSKRLNNRGIGIVLTVVDCPSIEPLRSEFTMVFSKRKNKEQRLEEQARERNELLERQRAAQLLLSARASPPPNPEHAVQAPTISQSGSTAMPPVQHTNMKFPASQASLNLPPQFGQAGPPIVRPRPRRISRDKESESDSDSDGYSNNSRKKKRMSNGGNSAGRNSQKELEDRVSRLEAALQASIREVEELRAAMNLCLYQLGEKGGLRRSTSQSVPWEFSGESGHYEPPASAPLVSALTMPSPQPARSPFELDAFLNGTLNGPESQLLRLRRDISTGSSQLPSPRSASAMGMSVPSLPKRSPTSESGQ